MDTYVINGVCRCCASQGSSKDIDTSYTWMGGEEIYSKMLRDCFDIALSRSVSGHDGGICELCVTQLRNAYNFKKQVVSTEEMLKKRLNSDQFKPSLVKVELEVHPERISDSDNDMGDHMDQDSGDDHSTKEFLVPIKSEVQEAPEVKPKRRATKAGTSAAKKPKLEAETSKSKPSTSATSNRRVLRKPQKNTAIKIPQEKYIIESKQDTPETPKRNRTVPKKLDSTVIKNRYNAKRYRETLTSLLLFSNANLIKKIDHGGCHCVVCPKKFSDAADLKEHFNELHSRPEALKKVNFKHLLHKAKVDITTLVCTLCFEKFDGVELILEHLRLEHEKMTYDGCNILPFTFDNPGYCCVFCESNFGTFKSLLSHMHTHYNNYICDICETGFFSKQAMLAHKKSHTAIKKAFACKHCEQKFDTDLCRVLHEKRMHLGMKPYYTCYYCPEKFQDYYQRNDHCIEIHGLKDMGNFQCRACDKRFRRSYMLRQHVRKEHLMEKIYPCGVCGKKMKSSQEIHDHMMMHKREPTEFVCGECEKTFNRKRTLQIHMLTHFPPQHACEFCNKVFSRKSGFTFHLRKQHGVTIMSSF